jgi:hypothetical protein
MAEQVIIEFIGDTSKLEEAYGKLQERVAESSGIIRIMPLLFLKANVTSF